MKRRITAVGTAMTLLGAAACLIPASPAMAADWGGSGPSVKQCTYGATVSTVGSTPITYDSGPAKGQVAGTVEIRWSDWCPSSNWARLTSRVTANRLSVSIVEQGNEGNRAGADDYNTSYNWSPAIGLKAGPSGRVCAYADIYSSGGRASGAICR